ncbi:MAG: hypothetical protein ACOY0R_21590 [Chloroflexota bacterium]
MSSILLIVLGAVILAAAAWLLAGRLEKLFFSKPATEVEAAIESPTDEPSSRPDWLEHFAAWAGPRQPVSAGRMAVTIAWLLVLLSLFDHLHSRTGFTGLLVYFLTILPHEAGHFLCSPFGWFLTVAGGSIWQVLLFVLFGGVQLLRNRRNEAFGWWVVAGHSLVSLSTYIADASARSLTLIPIPDPTRHDWGNLLEYLGLLQYDWLLAQLAIAVGGGLVLALVTAGIFFTWYPHRGSPGQE